ncbi:hypothetical protein [Streptomyces halobius]|uniref:Uncharacterized protein n=1 Tax=Streptomyces halobius TaxID=2879846 RepID=A0ABY4M406_9ACTN|nr:hypothetical protein [Streptomyces halobius]UQA92460.1 hypothetical protein K9S39_11980 [Streptomyces halobius]
MNSAEQVTHAEHPSAEVVVEVDSCATEDAHTVFSALRAIFVSDRAADDVPAEAPGPGATVWTATVDVTDLRAEGEPRPLAEPVTVNVQGGYWAVARLREGLATAFAVRVLGTAAGDQEQEVQLLLESLR